MTEKEYQISVGRSRTETAWMNKTVTWATLAARLKNCKRTAESVSDYKAMSRPQKGKAKDTGGFVGGPIDGGRRKGDSIICRSLVTLDIDYGQTDTPDIVADVLYDTAWCLYSTHSHTPETPRFRLVIPLSRDVTPDEYIPIARRIAEQIDIDIFDSSTYEPSRLMYWPSCPRDGEYVYRCSGADTPLDADEILASYNDWRNVAEWPMDKRTMRLVHGTGAKQEDPLTKPGSIGAFCRVYGITEAIEFFLPDVYEKTAHDDRYTFIGGTTAAGLVIYEDKYAYSHHGTDPCCEKLCNAFDLVRIHKFGELDQDSDINTPVAKLPSFVAMERFVREDPKVSGQMAKEKLHCKVTLCLLGDKRAFGPGVAELLDGVRRHGSLQGAAREMAMSYSKAWTIMRNAEAIWGFPLIRRYVGGKDGGRSVLTRQAEIILARYEQMNEALHAMADRQFQQWFNDDELQKLQTMEG